jgi:hypothetical protein
MAYNITWKDCEPTLENFVKNMKKLDKTYNLALITPVLMSYFRINKGKTPQDLEKELRKHNFDTGLIAKPVADDPYYSRILDEGKGQMIKLSYHTKGPDYPPEAHSDYVMIISCRPRKNVVEETLQSHDSMEENFIKLKDAGSLMIKSEDKDDVLEPDDIRYKENNIEKLIMEGKKLVFLEDIDPVKELKEVQEKYPDAKLTFCKRMSNGTPIFLYVKDNMILSKVGINVYLDEKGEKQQQYVFIS